LTERQNYWAIREKPKLMQLRSIFGLQNRPANTSSSGNVPIAGDWEALELAKRFGRRGCWTREDLTSSSLHAYVVVKK